MNSQREFIYKRRLNALKGDRIKMDIANMIFETSEDIVTENKTNNDYKNFEFRLISNLSISSPINEKQFESLSEEKIINEIYSAAIKNYQLKSEVNAKLTYPIIKNVYENPNNKYEKIVVPFSDGSKTLNVVTNLEDAYKSEGKILVDDFERNITLALIDNSWKNHLRKMDELKQSVQLAVHEQKDPLLIYKFEAFELFKIMIGNLNKEVLNFLVKSSIPNVESTSIKEAKARKKEKFNTSKDQVLNTEELASRRREISGNSNKRSETVTDTIVREVPKIGRNEKVEIKNISSGENKTLKFKQAKPLIDGGEWVMVSAK